MINIHDSLSSLRKQAQEAAQARDAAALMRLHNPDDQGLLEALNSASAELAQIEDSIDLFEASHRAQFIAHQAEEDQLAKQRALAGYEQAVAASQTVLDLAPQIDATIASLSELLYAWDKATLTRADAASCVADLLSNERKHEKRQVICTIARGYLAQPLTQAVLDSGLPKSMGQSGDITSSLIVRSESIAKVAQENHQLLMTHLDEVMEQIK